MNQLIENGVDVNIKSTTTGSTALPILVENGHFEALQSLVQKGANVNTTRIDGKTPLHLAVVNESTTFKTKGPMIYFFEGGSPSKHKHSFFI